MAGNSPQEAYKASPTTQGLRALAQTHLTEIEADLTAEAIQQRVTARDLQKYSKVRRNDRLKPRQSSTSPIPSHLTSSRSTHGTEQTKPKLRSAQDVLDRLRHDPRFNLSEYHVGYLERFEGIKEMPARAWIRESTDEDWIPQHRIRYVKRVNETDGKSEVVWDRDARLDHVFGSGCGIRNEGSGDDVPEGNEDEEQSEFGGVALSSIS